MHARHVCPRCECTFTKLPSRGHELQLSAILPMAGQGQPRFSRSGREVTLTAASLTPGLPAIQFQVLSQRPVGQSRSRVRVNLCTLSTTESLLLGERRLRVAYATPFPAKLSAVLSPQRVHLRSSYLLCRGTTVRVTFNYRRFPYAPRSPFIKIQIWYESEYCNNEIICYA